MKRMAVGVGVAVVAGVGLAFAQAGDPAKVLADAREALGGKKLEALTTLSATGRTLRTGPGGNTVDNEFELSLALPDKYLLRSVVMAMGNMSVYRNSGFNGAAVINEIDTPPNLSGGTMMVRFAGPGGTSMDPAKMTPEQKAEADRAMLLTNRKELTRLALGMFAGPIPSYPLEFVYGGQAESPDGKADVIDVKGEGGFAVRLFVDQQTHLPLMLSWMDKEPLVMQMQSGPGGRTVTMGSGTFTAAGGPGGAHVTMQGGGPGAKPMTDEERAAMMKDLEARRKEAEANRRTVEYRVYYTDYKPVAGLTLPHRIQRSIDGKTSEEMIFESIKVNPKIDAKTFQPSK